MSLRQSSGPKVASKAHRVLGLSGRLVNVSVVIAF
jgi:hypothetical protein